jgi:prepilin-type N-terminal cleavage/methylation domain-containing protein
MNKRGFALIKLPGVSKRCFTLIELLIVIAIIGILSLIVVINISGAQEKARDTKRKADLESVKSALEAYRANKSQLPLQSTCSTAGSICGAMKSVSFLNIEPEFSRYLDKEPTDPNGVSNYQIFYAQIGTTIGYKVIATTPELLKNATATTAPKIAGDYYDSINFRRYQVSSNSEMAKRADP